MQIHASTTSPVALSVARRPTARPQGPALRYYRRPAPGIELFAADGVHPGPAGSYLAGCAIYAALTERSPVGVALVLPDGAPVAALDAGDARRLQEIAWRAFTGYPQPQ